MISAVVTSILMVAVLLVLLVGTLLALGAAVVVPVFVIGQVVRAGQRSKLRRRRSQQSRERGMVLR